MSLNKKLLGNLTHKGTSGMNNKKVQYPAPTVTPKMQQKMDGDLLIGLALSLSLRIATEYIKFEY